MSRIHAIGLIGLLVCLLVVSSFSHSPAIHAAKLTEMPSPIPSGSLFPWPGDAPYTAIGVYQPFEHGFMAWRSDYDCAYAILWSTEVDLPIGRAITPTGAYGYCLTDTGLTDHSVPTPPAGLFTPTDFLGKLWAYYPAIQSGLGYATRPAQRYVTIIPSNDGAPAMDGLPFDWAQMTLPTLRTLACGSRAATGGTCNY